MRHARALALALALGSLLAAGGAARAADAPDAAAQAAGVSLGVAPFERNDLGPKDAPDVASLLADRLATRGVGRVVGPNALGAPAAADASADQVRAWATHASVGGVVLGRMTRIGTRLSIDARLLSGASGAVLGTFVAEVARPEGLAGAVDQLASEIVEKAASAVVASPSAAPRATAERKKGGGGPGVDQTSLGITIRKDAPLNIRSNELEAVQEGKSRRFVFTGDVKVTQDDLSLTSDRLDAFYPDGASQPERLVAKGRVVVTQQDKRASCDEATFLNREQRVFCRGSAEMSQGQDRVRGKEIEIDIDSNKMFVRGGAEVRIQPKTEATAASGGAADTPAGATPPVGTQP